MVRAAENSGANQLIGKNMDANFKLLGDDALYILTKQARGEPLTGNEQLAAIRLIDAGLLGMDGFRFCTVDEALESWRLFHKGHARL
jgi:hypothetical protein